MLGTLEEQIRLEKEQHGVYTAKYTNDINNAIRQQRMSDIPEGKVLIKLGYIPFRDKIQEYLDSNTRGQKEKDKNYLRLLSTNANEIAYISLKILINSLNSTPNVTTISNKIVQHLERLHLFNKLKEDNPKLHSYLGTEYKRASARRKEKLINHHIKSLYDIDIQTGENTSRPVRVGTELINLLIQSGANLVYITTKYKQKKSHKYLHLTDEAYEVLKRYGSSYNILNSTMLPCIVPPKDWVGLKEGGYHFHQTKFVKTYSNSARRFYKEHEEELIPSMKIVNKLQRTSWRVNTRVLDILSDVFYGNMIDPTSSPELPRCYGGIPTSNVITVESIIGPKPEYVKENKKEFAKWNKQRERIQIGLDAEASRRLDLLMTIDVANKVIDYDKIYFVYTVDYRGRVYANNEFLNPQRASYIKAMLEFGEGEYLTEEGVKWLKIHTANVYGNDKLPFDERVRWFDDNEQDIIKVGINPLSNISTWGHCDSPYEFLAACFAYKDYLSNKKVYLPIQLDATCSGIQFYSGLLKDAEGGKLVNIIGDNREDIYQAVADKCNTYLLEGNYPKYVGHMDSEGVDHLLNTKKEVQCLAGNITRSMVKRNVMTIPYSVSMRGMTQQNWDMMNDMRLKGKAFWLEQEVDEWLINKILSETIWECAYSILQGAKLGQTYLKEVAKLQKEPAVWHTPRYNFPVLQPALKYDEHRVKTVLGTLLIKFKNSTLDKQKQSNGIAPNYVHSIDATVLMYCIEHISCDIGVIHDCFSVLPNNAEEIRNLYKEGFIDIMSRNPLSKFSTELDPNGIVDVPSVGTLDLDDIQDSMYIIS